MIQKSFYPKQTRRSIAELKHQPPMMLQLTLHSNKCKPAVVPRSVESNKGVIHPEIKVFTPPPGTRRQSISMLHFFHQKGGGLVSVTDVQVTAASRTTTTPTVITATRCRTDTALAERHRGHVARWAVPDRATWIKTRPPDASLPGVSPGGWPAFLVCFIIWITFKLVPPQGPLYFVRPSQATKLPGHWDQAVKRFLPLGWKWVKELKCLKSRRRIMWSVRSAGGLLQLWQEYGCWHVTPSTNEQGYEWKTSQQLVVDENSVVLQWTKAPDPFRAE